LLGIALRQRLGQARSGGGRIGLARLERLAQPARAGRRRSLLARRRARRRNRLRGARLRCHRTWAQKLA